jgi:regulator of replication initiation timing
MEVLEKETELSELELEQVQDEIKEVCSENENLKLKINNLLHVLNCIPRKTIDEALDDKPELKNILFEIFRKYDSGASI